MPYRRDFLNKLDHYPIKETYIRITAFNNDYPTEQIQGDVLSGSINVDGKSNVRRTCNIQMISRSGINDAYWALKTIIQVEIGLVNKVDNRYDSIVWFKQGYFVLTGFSINETPSGYTISLTGKDKMCLLNGDISGNFLENSIDFGKEEYYDANSEETIYTKIPVKDIVKNLMILYAHENPNNIIINDIPNYGVELLEYRGADPLYWVHQNTNGQAEDNIKNSLYIDGNIETSNGKTLANIEKDNSINSFLSANTSSSVGEAFRFDSTGTEYKKSEILFGQAAGYHAVPLTYPDDLIANVGETITSVLDKIVNMLGNYEYFYDVDGHFVFQEQKNYINTSFNLANQNSDYLNLEGSYLDLDIAYEFNDETLISNISQTADIANVKNDFSVWGSRKSGSGSEIPCGMRYAIQRKPESYKSLDGKTYTISNVKDWRELIFRMGQDHLKYNQDLNFLSRIKAANPWAEDGKTGYEQYYTDIVSFWPDNMIHDEEDDTYDFDESKLATPETMQYWLEFINPSGDLGRFSVEEIGRRTKAVNDPKVTGIYFQNVPDVLFFFPSDKGKTLSDFDLTGYSTENRIQVPEQLESYFVLSSQSKSAKDVLDELIYQYTYYIDTIQLTTIPIYYLEPNTRIKLSGKYKGEYNLSSYSYQFGANGSMTISATRIIPTMYRY